MAIVDASIVIPAWNSKGTIGECLESVLAQRTDKSYEVIVVDSSNDGTDEVVRRFPQVKLIKLGKRTFSGAARNIGFAETSASIVLFLDSDTVAEPYWLEKMLEWHKNEDCAVIAGAVVNGNPESLIGWASYITEFSEYFPSGSKRCRQTAVTANISYKRDVFERFGGFDEDLRQYVDAEFNCRLTSAGEKLLFVPSLMVKHKHRTTMPEYFKHEVGRGKAASALRRRDLLPCSILAKNRVLCILTAVPMFLRMVYRNIARFLPTRMLPFSKLAVVIPISIVGSFAYTYGFVSESIVPRINDTRKKGDWSTRVESARS